MPPLPISCSIAYFSRNSVWRTTSPVPEPVALSSAVMGARVKLELSPRQTWVTVGSTTTSWLSRNADGMPCGRVLGRAREGAGGGGVGLEAMVLP